MHHTAVGHESTVDEKSNRNSHAALEVNCQKHKQRQSVIVGLF